MIPKKVLVNNDNMATFVCPKCKTMKTIDVLKYIGKAVQKQHLYKCTCGHKYTVLLERRRFYRKEVNIPGYYTIIEKERIKKAMTVKDLSRTGLGIELLETDLNLKIGDRIFVEFQLDNKQQTMIRKEVVIRTIFNLKIGTEFCSRDLKNPIDKAYDIAIGYYTFSR